MKRIFIIIAAIAITFSGVYIFISKHNRPEPELWGYINIEGKMVVEPRFAYAGYFNASGTAYVEWGKCCTSQGCEGCSKGFIDRSGTLVKEINEDNEWQLNAFHDGRAAVRVCGDTVGECLTGFLDETGKQVIDYKYENLTYFSEGLAAVNEVKGCLDWPAKCKYKYIDTNNNVVVEGPFTEAWPFKEGKAFVEECDIADNSKKNCKKYLIDKQQNKTPLPDNILFFHPPFLKDGFLKAVYDVKDNSKPNEGLVDANGNVVVGPEYCRIRSFHDGLAAISTCKNCGASTACKWGFINNQGELVIEPKYDEASDFSEGMAHFEDIDLGAGYIDTSGSLVFVHGFFFARNFQEGLAAVTVPEDSTIKNYLNVNTGEFLSPEEYANKHSDTDYYLPGFVNNNTLIGFIDKTGNIVIEPAKYKETHGFSNGLAAVQLCKESGCD